MRESEPRTLNPFFAGDRVATSIANRLYETILGRWEDAPRPWLADLRDPADVQQIGLDFNPDAQWQDGTPVTADDFLTSLSAAQKLGRFDDLWNVGDQQDGYLRIDLDAANAFFVPDVLRKLSVLPQKIWGGIPPDDWPEVPQGQGGDPSDLLGSGPYRFETWDHGKSLRLVRSSAYWGGTPGNQEVLEWRFFPSLEELVAARCAGELDDVDIVPADQPQRLDCIDPQFVSIQPYSTSESTNVWFNLNRGNLGDRTVRRALGAAIDRSGIAEELYGRYVDVVPGTQSPLSPAYSPEIGLSYSRFDPEWAKAELATAGLTDVFFTLTVEPGVDPLIAEAIAADWALLGVSVQVESVPDWQRLQTREFDAWLGRFWWPPSGDQSIVFGSQRRFNFTGYENAEYEALTAEAKREPDADARREILQQAELMILEDVPAIILWYQQGLALVNTQVQNFDPFDRDVFWSLPNVVVEG